MNKFIKVISAVSAAALLLTSCSSAVTYPSVLTSSPSQKTSLTKNSDDSPLVIAKGGFAANYPADTVPAIVAAFENGFDGVYLDVWQNDKDEVMLSPTADLSEITGQNIDIKEINTKNREDYPVIKGRNIKKLKPLYIPTLEEALEVVKDYSGYAVLNFSSPGRSVSSAGSKKIEKLLKKYGLSDKAAIVSDSYSVFRFFGGKNIRRCIEEAADDNSPSLTVDEIKDYADHGVTDVILPSFDELKDDPTELVSESDAAGLCLSVRADVDKTQYKYLSSLGVRYIISDHTVASE